MFRLQMITIASWLGITWCLLTTLIEGYPFGAPPTRCGAMIPGHNGTMPQAVPPPYTITVSNTTLSPGQSVLVTISSSSSSQIFAGFLLKAVSADQQTIVNGTFTPPNGTQTIQCQDVKGNALTHTDNSDKKSITVVWSSTSSLQGNVFFRATVVEEFDEFWVNVTSPIIYYSAPATIAPKNAAVAIISNLQMFQLPFGLILVFIISGVSTSLSII